VRLRALALEDLLDRLTPGFDVLDSPAGHPSRHPTLRAALDWSHELCTPAEARLWRRLSVFAGSFDLDAAAFVGGDDEAGAPVGALLGLVDKSIVTREDGGTGARYRLLEPIRRYGADRLAALDDPAARRDRHATWYRRRARRAEAACATRGQLGAMRDLRSDYPQIRAALEHTLGSGPEQADAALSLVISLRSYWIMRSPLGEARRWVDVALALPVPPDPGRNVALWLAAAVGVLQGDADAARSRLAQGRSEATATGDEEALTYLGYVAGAAALVAGDAGAREESRRSLAMKIELDDPLGITITVEQLAWLAGAARDHVTAATLLGAATRLWSARGRPWFGFDGLLVLRERCLDDARRRLGDDAFDRAYGHGETLGMRAAARHALAVTG